MKLQEVFRPRTEDVLFKKYNVLTVKIIFSVNNKSRLQLSQVMCALQFCATGTA